MQISPTTNSMSTNFKAVNVVQIPKKAFSHPENLMLCEKEFSKAIDSATGERLKGFWGVVVALFTTKLQKTGVLSENPTYIFARNSMQKNSIKYSLSWVSQNMGIPIKEPLEEGMHSFYVFTKDDKQGLVDTVKNVYKNIFRYAKEGIKKYPSDEKLADLYSQTSMGYSIEKGINQIIGERNIPRIEVKTLDDLPKIVKDLDV